MKRDCIIMDAGQIFSDQKLSDLLSKSAGQYQNLLSFFDDYEFDLEGTNHQLLELAQLLLDSYTLLNELFTDDINVSQLLPYFDWIQEGKNEFYQLNNGIKTVEKILLHLMKIIEEEFETNEDEQFRKDLSVLFDLIEELSDTLVSLKPITVSLKNLFDTAVEFNEIFKDHMNSLDMEIESNLKKCIELQEKTFISPVRHNKLTFSLDQLIKLLSSSNTPTKGLCVPAFSPLEQSIHDKLVELEEASSPIELSLNSVLSQRLDSFETRDVVNLEYLMRLLRKKYHYIIEKYDLLQQEIEDLKHAIIDEKWRLIFINLNDELRIMLRDTEKLLIKIANPDLSDEITSRFKEQLQVKTQTIDKTFTVIYTAIESLVLSESIATVTNEYAEKWLQLKTQYEEYIPEDNTKEEEEAQKTINALSDNISELKLNDGPTEKPGSNRSSIGALIFKKMNIRPVIVQEKDERKYGDETYESSRSSRSTSSTSSTSSTASNGLNPFYEPTSSHESKAPKVLNLSKVPPLSFDEPSGLMSSLKTIKTPTVPLSPSATPTTITKDTNSSSSAASPYEVERLISYGMIPTRIPSLYPSTLPPPIHLTVLFKLNSGWIKQRHHKLKAPRNYTLIS